jgi:hypothetical protein
MSNDRVNSLLKFSAQTDRHRLTQRIGGCALTRGGPVVAQ